ncbi:MAG: class I SAM-dependent methyltransferase, partial [Gammaproteobacteria bacterium]|nr:class I SAM-dependent methyltransferase [Gammaproteobacteria bacterium]
MTALTEFNNLVLGSDGIWRVTDTTEDIGYSDGAEVEAYLKKCFSECVDLSSTSTELEQRIIDWPTEYHLSPMRVNLLRAFDMTSMNKVLELGAGCGTITRFLCESGLDVDAIEGSASRASLAQQRCRGLENVSVINNNFNDLRLPENHYDGIFSVGVMEYAKYFASGEGSHRDTVKAILNNLFVSLNQTGCIVIAIENRLGLKYLFGAGEDHYGKAYTGIYDYRTDDSIRTYSKNEWLAIFSELEISSHSFLYPFPDYKVPSVILRDEYLRNNPHAATHFARVASRDYSNLLAHNHPEQIFWEGLQQENLVDSLSNSFLIVLARSDEAINNLVANDFVHCSGLARKPAYRTVSYKPVGEKIVYKNKIHPEITSPDEDVRLLHRPKEEPFVVGETLADQWCKEILGGRSVKDFQKSLWSYYNYLLRCRDDYKESGELIDLLAFNIIVLPDSSYQAIDHEWRWVDGEVEPEFVLFRALLYFAINEQNALRNVFAQDEIHTIRQF